ncbi:MAG TPA: hypothetical protein DCQ04_02600 [Actinobacteria bacterium]|nr:hypothetical protein [Actinomycetota bacterium]
MTTLFRDRSLPLASACLFVIFGLSKPAIADDAICSVEDPHPDDVFRTWLSWMTNSDGTVQPQFEIRALARSNMAYEIEGRINFGGEDITWEQGPYFLADEETSFVDVEIPSSAFMNEQQVDYLSTLVVRVTAYDTTTGEELERQSAPRLKAAWSTTSSVPMLFDEETARLVAPGGIVSEEVRSNPNVLLEELGYIYEYAPQN